MIRPGQSPETVFGENNNLPFAGVGKWLITDSKRNFNTAIAAIKRLKSDVNHCSESTQENFGNDSDMVNAMLLTLIDRCGDDDNLAYKMYEYIKSFPSKLNLDLDLDNAFSHLFRKS